MLDDDHVRLLVDAPPAVFVVEDADHAIAPPRDQFESQVERDLGVGAAERAEVGRIRGAADIGRKHALRGDDLELRAGFGDEFGGGQAGVGAIVVVDDHLAARPRRAREEVPTRGRERVA